MFPLRTLRKIASILHKAGIIDKSKKSEQLIDPGNFPGIDEHLVNKNTKNIIKQLGERWQLKKIMFYQFVPEALLQWRQPAVDNNLLLIFFLEHTRIPSFPIEVLPGTHKKLLKPEEQAIILDNSVSSELNLQQGGALLLKSLLLNRFSETLKDKNLRFFILVFG
jgi:hypothetical protein